MLYKRCCVPTAVRIPHATYTIMLQLLLFVMLCVVSGTDSLPEIQAANSQDLCRSQSMYQV